MPSFAVRTWFAPSELPDIRASLPLRSNHASVLHGYPFVRAYLPTGTIQAQIVFQRGQEWLINGGEDVRGCCFAAEITIAKRYWEDSRCTRLRLLSGWPTSAGTGDQVFVPGDSRAGDVGTYPHLGKCSQLPSTPPP